MKKYILVIFAFVFFNSQAQTWSWAKSGKSNDGDECWGSCTDPSGNLCLTGWFSGSTIVFGTYTLTNSGSLDAYVTKYDPSGNVLWAKKIGGTGSEGGHGLCTDASGNVYLTGSFTSTLITIGTSTFSNSGLANIFVAKFDPLGNILWARNMSGTGDDQGNSLDTDASGNVFVTGWYTSPILTVGTTTLSNSGSYDMFFVKYDTNGNLLWAKKEGGTNNDRGYNLNTDLTGNIYLAGAFGSPVLTIGTNTLNNSGSLDAFLAKYDNNGNPLWANSSGGGGLDGAYYVDHDLFGNVYTTGYFLSSSLNCGTVTVNNAGSASAYLAKYDPNGNVMWAKSIGGTGSDIGYCVGVKGNDVFISGSLGSNTITIGTYTINKPVSPNDAMFLIQFDLNGNPFYATGLAGGGDDNNFVCVDNFCSAYIAGDFIPNPFSIGTLTLTNFGSENVFAAKLSYLCSDVGINEALPLKIADIYPNPNNGIFHLQVNLEIEKGELVIFNLMGQKVFTQTIRQGENEIRPGGLSKGLYHYSILQNKTLFQKGKIVVE